ncbi:hypothetical protein MNBD_BACTEROID01-1333 [hydrothermal vent metagenome]|uniref:Uncharacterized protein n=1 Tax=hydrothermal vent metagenome TaxID=652676 RepID=A0A3B0U767_9ZZZZ
MEKQDNKVSFALAKITTEQFATIESKFCETDDIKLQANFRFAADKENKLVGVFANFTFECGQEAFIIIEAGCHFKIKPESWEKLLKSDDNTLVIPKGIIQHLAVITVGTTRGILHAKTENTSFNQFYIPTINMAEMIKQDSVFEFKTNVE